MAAELLQNSGCQVLQAQDGVSALAVLGQEAAIELVVSDIAMPGGMSGLELARIVRKRYPGIPILLVTGYSQYATQVINEGFTLIEKPFHRDAFAAAVRAAIRGAAAGARQIPEIGS